MTDEGGGAGGIGEGSVAGGIGLDFVKVGQMKEVWL